MMRGKRVRLLALGAVIALGVAVYGASTVAGATDSVGKVRRAAAFDKKVAMIIAQGGLGDKSYNDLANSGLKQAETKYGFTAQRIQSADIVSQGAAILQQACAAGFDLVIDLEFSTSDALQKTAPSCSKTQWTFLNLPLKAANVTGVVFAEHEGSYLAGALAALVTQDTSIPGINARHVIGVIGGTKSTGIDKFLVGYTQGARRIDKNIKVLVKYSNNFGDPAKGKQIADAMFDQGADIVYQVAGGTGLGIIQAAKARHRYAIGVDTDQSYLAPKNVLTSMVKRSDLAVYDSVKMLADGTLGNAVVNLDLKSGGVGLGKIVSSVPKRDIARVNALKSQIVSGKIKVWDVITQGYPSWFKTG
jgi:basic membrane protein A and related proteins